MSFAHSPYDGAGAAPDQTSRGCKQLLTVGSIFDSRLGRSMSLCVNNAALDGLHQRGTEVAKTTAQRSTASLRKPAPNPAHKDVVAMPLTRTKTLAPARRARPAGPSCRSGVSSLLRLTQPAAARLPQAGDLSGWLGRAASVFLPVTGPLAAFVPSEFGHSSQSLGQ